MGATAEKISQHDPGRDMLLRNSVDVLRAFNECSDEIQRGILDMAQILSDPNTDEDEKAAAADTLLEALYPQYIGEELGMDSEQYDAIQKESECASEPDLDVSLDREEATFAERLRELMDKNGISQTRLAEMIGVGQPAISMMLSRSCRPQLRTVEKIAQALGVSVNSLWPDS